MKKDFISFSLVFVILFTSTFVLTGCRNIFNTNGNENRANTVDNSKGPKEEPMEITWLGPTSGGSGFVLQPDGEIEQELEGLLNVKLTPIQVDIWAGDSFTLMIASGVIPDVFMWGDSAPPYQLIKQGIAREISKEAVREYAPFITKKIDEVEPRGWLKATFGGKLYAIPVIEELGAIPNIDLYRKDWAENLGIANRPETIDEVKELLMKFTKNDPDKNGLNDTYGLSSFSEWTPENFRWFQIFAAFGAAPRWFHEKGGQVVYGAIHESYKEALKFLQELYREGVIDPDFHSLKYAQYMEKIATGNVGYIDHYPGHLRESMEKQIIVKNNKAKLDLLPRIIGPRGDYGSLTWDAANGWMVLFGRDVPDEKLAIILKMMDRIAYDDEIFKLAIWGKLGVHYDRQGDLLVSRPIYNTGEARSKLGLGAHQMGFYAFFCRYKKHVKYIVDEAGMKDIDETYAYAKAFKNTIFTPLVSYEDKKTVLESIINKFYYNAITGKIDIDAEWDTYVSEWLESGGKEVMEEARQAFYSYRNQGY